MLSSEETSVLSKGLSLCPEADIDKFKSIKDLQLFARKLLLKSMYNKDTISTEEKVKNEKALDELIDLLDEQEGFDLINRLDVDTLLNVNTTMKEVKLGLKSKLKKKSDKFPSPNSNINLGVFLAMTTQEIKNSVPILVRHVICLPMGKKLLTRFNNKTRGKGGQYCYYDQCPI